MLGRLLKKLFGERKPRVRILCASVEDFVHFSVDDEITTVNRKDLINSPLAQTYAPKGARVVDIRECNGIFKDNERKGYDIYLDNGIKYSSH